MNTMKQQASRAQTQNAYPSPAPQPAQGGGGMPRPQVVHPQPHAQGQVQGQPYAQPHAQPQTQPQIQPMSHPAPQGMAPPMSAQRPPMPQAHPGHMQPPPQHVQAPPQHYGAPDMIDEDRDAGERALPQISVHAFCDRNETASTINETTRDWRMKRTTMKIYMGGVDAAIEYYRNENTPNLILIESGLRGPQLFAQLEELASVCEPGTKVVMIGAVNDIKLYRQLMDKGISDYLVPPFHPLHLIRSLADIYIDPEKPFVGRTVAFFGAKGGVGSSTLAHNIAWCMSEILGNDTALVDLDASWGTTGLDFAYDASQGLEEVLAKADGIDDTFLDRIMIRHSKKLSILPTAGSLNSAPVMTPEAYESVVDTVRSISPMTILDMPHQWVEWTTRVLTAADDVVITATPDLASLRNTKNLFDFLKAQRPNDAAPILILNKTGMTKTNEISVKDFAAAVGCEPALVIGFDPDTFVEAANDGKMLTEIKAATQTVKGLGYISTRLKTGHFDLDMPGSGKKGGLSLFSKKSAKGGKPEKTGSLFSKLKFGK